jgi:thioredoxin-related protein
MKKILPIALLLFSVVFTACSSDDNDNNPESSFSATINGVEWKPKKINMVTLIKVPGSGQRFDINVQDDSVMLALACESELTSNDAMPLKQYNFFDDPTDDQVSNALFINTYLYANGNSLTEHIPVSGKITITSMDAAKKTVSGTFSFRNEKIQDEESKIKVTTTPTPVVFEVTNGLFTNLSYTVITAQN